MWQRALTTSHEWTYQSDTQKEDLKNPSDAGGADNVTVSHGGHGDHQKVNTLPIPQLVHIAEIRRVSAVLQLEERDPLNSGSVIGIM